MLKLSGRTHALSCMHAYLWVSAMSVCLVCAQERFGPAAPTSLVALDLLLGEVFFTSPRLANLATQVWCLTYSAPGFGLPVLHTMNPGQGPDPTCTVSCVHRVHLTYTLWCGR